jgi:hypothetical protein
MLFYFCIGMEGRKDLFLLLPMCFHWIPKGFDQVLNYSPNSQCVPQDVPNSTKLLSHMF